VSDAATEHRQSLRDTNAARDAGGVLVLGGGLAGLAAAVRLAEQGRAVTLIETSRRLGGRATSHADPDTGQLVDNCQHVLLGCCTNLLDLYDRLGVGQHVQWHRRLHFFDKHGRHDILAAGLLPAPAHLSISMMRFGCLTMREKLAVSRAMIAIMRLSAAERDALNDITFTAWLEQRRQPRSVIEKFWAVIIVSALNCHPDHAAAGYALHVFQDGFLRHRDAYAMGVSAVPLRELYDPAVAHIERAGGRVLFGASVRQLHYDPGARRITAVELADGQTLHADTVISALPFDRLDRVIDDALRRDDPRLSSLNEIRHSPILGIHLYFAGPWCPHPHMIFVDSPLQWVFNKSTVEDPAAPQGAAQHLHGVISAADDWVAMPSGEIIDMAIAELACYLPADSPDAKLLRGRVIKEKRATFLACPGVQHRRPTADGPTQNLLLAGDWVETGWPATMEGAVRSGYRAAAALEEAATSQVADSPGVIADLQPAMLYRLLSR